MLVIMYSGVFKFPEIYCDNIITYYYFSIHTPKQNKKICDKNRKKSLYVLLSKYILQNLANNLVKISQYCDAVKLSAAGQLSNHFIE